MRGVAGRDLSITGRRSWQIGYPAALEDRPDSVSLLEGRKGLWATGRASLCGSDIPAPAPTDEREDRDDHVQRLPPVDPDAQVRGQFSHPAGGGVRMGKAQAWTADTCHRRRGRRRHEPRCCPTRCCWSGAAGGNWQRFRLLRLQGAKRQPEAFGPNQRPLSQFHGLRGWRMWCACFIHPKRMRTLLISASIGHEAHTDQTAISTFGISFWIVEVSRPETCYHG
jgi:hypothetical protein